MARSSGPEKLGLGPTLRALPAAFDTANLMEAFERMAWYGFFADSSNHLTGPATESFGCGILYLIVNIGGSSGR